MKEHWGTITWRFLHTLLENINEEKFNIKRNDIIDLINYIGLNLPCGICSYHYRKNNIISVENMFYKNSLIIKLWAIHNNVNESRNVNVYSIGILDQYKSYDYKETENDFFEKISIYKTIDMNKVRECLNKIL